MKIENLKIGTRLITGFGIVILIFLVSAIITLITVKNASTEIKNVEAKSIPSVLLAEELVVQTLRIQVLLQNVLVTEELNRFAQVDKEALTIKKNIAKFKDEYKNVLNLKNFEKAFQDYYTHGKDMSFVFLTEGKEEGNKMLKDFENKAENLNDIIYKFQKEHLTEASESIQKAVKANKQVQFSQLMASIIAALLAIGLGLFISRSIVFPVKKLRDTVLEITKGKLDAKIDVKSEDEIGELAFSFNEMTQHLNTSIQKEKASCCQSSGR